MEMGHGKWLHLGCGKRILPGAVHIDIGNLPHIDFRHDIRTLPMIGDASCDGIYTSHCFPYVAAHEAPAVLAEWKRVLKRGGILRIAVPNFKALCALYTETGDISLVLGPIYGRWQPSSGTPTLRDGAGSNDIFQKTVYDESSLSKVLLESGFTQVKLWDWREVFTGDWLGFDDYSQAYYPHMDKENGRLMSLNMEAVA